jgi:hypothetical protein
MKISNNTKVAGAYLDKTTIKYANMNNAITEKTGDGTK